MRKEKREQEKERRGEEETGTYCSFPGGNGEDSAHVTDAIEDLSFGLVLGNEFFNLVY